MTTENTQNEPTADNGEQMRPVHIRESGLLWLINKSLMHPRGYALAYDDDTQQFFVMGDGEEAWHFNTVNEDPAKGIDEDVMLAKIKALLP